MTQAFNLSHSQVRCYADVSVTVPAVTDPDVGSATATCTGVKLGDIVIAAPVTALETNARFTNAYVSATDTVTFVFASLGGNITGGAETFNVQVYEKS